MVRRERGGREPQVVGCAVRPTGALELDGHGDLGGRGLAASADGQTEGPHHTTLRRTTPLHSTALAHTPTAHTRADPGADGPAREQPAAPGCVRPCS